MEPTVVRALQWHAHPHQHGRLSRREILKAGGLGMAALAGTAAFGVQPAWADKTGKTTNAAARPIPGGFEIDGTTFHVFDPVEGNEPNTLIDFDGFVAVATGVGSGVDGSGRTMPFAIDNRFFSGKFVGRDGREHDGTFGFF